MISTYKIEIDTEKVYGDNVVKMMQLLCEINGINIKDVRKAKIHLEIIPKRTIE